MFGFEFLYPSCEVHIVSIYSSGYFYGMKTAVKYTQQERDIHLHAWEESNLTKKEYAIQQNLKYSTFKNWTYRDQKKANHSLSEQFPETSGSFIPIKGIEFNSDKSSTIRITYPNEVVVTCSGVTDIEQISKLIKLY